MSASLEPIIKHPLLDNQPAIYRDVFDLQRHIFEILHKAKINVADMSTEFGEGIQQTTFTVQVLVDPKTGNNFGHYGFSDFMQKQGENLPSPKEAEAIARGTKKIRVSGTVLLKVT